MYDNIIRIIYNQNVDKDEKYRTKTSGPTPRNPHLNVLPSIYLNLSIYCHTISIYTPFSLYYYCLCLSIHKILLISVMYYDDILCGQNIDINL